MRNIRRSFPGWLGVLLTAGLAVLASVAAAPAQKTTLDELVSSVVRIKTHINPDGRTVEGLGREREGSGVVIDDKGLVLTIGYLMTEAHAAEIVTNDGRVVPANIVGYDHETGFGLLQAIAPIKAKPLSLGKSASVKEKDPVVVASFGGLERAGAAFVVSKREFVGNWEYVVEDALFTSPPHTNNWSGAALISQDGKLVGVGSLMVGDASGKHDNTPGNMFVPIDLLPPILADLIADGRASGPGRPWLGINTEDIRGHMMISRVTPEGPAEKAGLRRHDVILSINGETPRSVVDLYRKMWGKGGAGSVVALDIQRETARMHIDVKSINRLDHLKLKSTF
jgi:S1-C subfamily serine protease